MASPDAPHYPEPAQRRLITAFVMMSAIMNMIDTTIANVALPHMQGTTSASAEEITWVLTSYIVASAIFTPLTGWLANRFGRKRLLLLSIIGFTAVSGLCGMASTLGELILFRLLQGVFGSSLVPMSQSTLLDINPPERHGPAMAVFGMAAILGPLIGPLAGGYLTDNFSWRWVFYINLPIGMIALVGLYLFMPDSQSRGTKKLDIFGFALLAVGLGAIQLLLDRGQQLDWFSSTEIRIEATVGALGLYLFTVHALTTKNPFLSPAIFRDWNFVVSTAIGFALGVLIYAVMSLLPPMMESLLGYSTFRIGLTMAPRGIGTLIAMLLVARLITRVDPRLMVIFGLLASALSLYMLSHLSLQADSRLLILSGIVQGIGASSVFVPLTTLGFATLSARYRDEGSALGALTRNMGASVGIAVIEAMTIRNADKVQSRLVEPLRPDNPLLAWRMPGLDWSSAHSLEALQAMVAQQASMVSYIDSFWALCLVGMISAPFVFLLRVPRRKQAPLLDAAGAH
jgi:DHA2 family multidrug resistance protein